jgi:hypothetical protein
VHVWVSISRDLCEECCQKTTKSDRASKAQGQLHPSMAFFDANQLMNNASKPPTYQIHGTYCMFDACLEYLYLICLELMKTGASWRSPVWRTPISVQLWRRHQPQQAWPDSALCKSAFSLRVCTPVSALFLRVSIWACKLKSQQASSRRMRSVSKGNPSYARETSESLTRPGLRTWGWEVLAVEGVHEYLLCLMI